MARGKGKKRVLWAGALFLAAILLIWFSLQLWFPWVLEPAARNQGVSYAAYQRKGYSRFELRGLVFTNRTTDFQAEKIEALVPTTWLLRSALGRAAQPYAEVYN